MTRDRSRAPPRDGPAGARSRLWTQEKEQDNQFGGPTETGLCGRVAQALSLTIYFEALTRLGDSATVWASP